MQLDDHDVLLVIGVRGSGKSYWVDHELRPKCKRVCIWDPHGEFATRERVSLDELVDRPELLDRENISLSVVPSWRTVDELSDQFETFADLVPSMDPGTVVIVEEVALLKRSPESLVYLATQSRHWGVPLVFVSQRAVRVHIDAREQVSRIVSFRQSSPADVAALVERCGPDAERVKTLPRYEFWAWDENQAFDNKPTTDGQSESECLS